MSEIGYGGSVDEANWSTLAPHLGVEYSVHDASDWNLTAVPTSDRTVSISVGTGTGKGITGITTTTVQKTLSSVPSDYRWDLIVRRRDTSGAGGTSTFEVIEGTSDPNAVFALRETFGDSSTVDDQPLWLVRVDAGSTNITAIEDVRVWQGNSGAVAKSDYVRQYLTAPGTQVMIGTDLWTRTVSGVDNTVAWRKAPLLAPVNLLGAGSVLDGGSVPAGSAIYVQTGTQAAFSDPSGYTRLTFPTPFPNGLLSVVLTNGDDSAAGGMVANVAGGSPFGTGNRSYVVYRTWGPGGIVASRQHRVNYVAVGW